MNRTKVDGKRIVHQHACKYFGLFQVQHPSRKELPRFGKDKSTLRHLNQLKTKQGKSWRVSFKESREQEHQQNGAAENQLWKKFFQRDALYRRSPIGQVARSSLVSMFLD